MFNVSSDHLQVSSPHTFFPPYERASPRHHGNSPLHRAPLLRGSPWSSPHPSVGSSPHPIGSSPHPGADPKTAVHNFSPGPEHAALELRSQLYRAALLQTSSPFGPPPFPFPSTAYFPRPAFHPSLDSLPVSISSFLLSTPVSSSGEDPVPPAPVWAVLFPPASTPSTSNRPSAQLSRFETESSPLAREGGQSLASAEAAGPGAGETRRPTEGAAAKAGEGEAVHSKLQRRTCLFMWRRGLDREWWIEAGRRWRQVPAHPRRLPPGSLHARQPDPAGQRADEEGGGA